MKGARQLPQQIIRLPLDVKSFVDQQAKAYGSSQNSEIVRALRERMDRLGIRETPVQDGE